MHLNITQDTQISLYNVFSTGQCHEMPAPVMLRQGLAGFSPCTRPIPDMDVPVIHFSPACHYAQGLMLPSRRSSPWSARQEPSYLPLTVPYRPALPALLMMWSLVARRGQEQSHLWMWNQVPTREAEGKVALGR
jgi:hypothetical protein